MYHTSFRIARITYLEFVYTYSLWIGKNFLQMISHRYNIHARTILILSKYSKNLLRIRVQGPECWSQKCYSFNVWRNCNSCPVLELEFASKITIWPVQSSPGSAVVGRQVVKQPYKHQLTAGLTNQKITGWTTHMFGSLETAKLPYKAKVGRGRVETAGDWCGVFWCAGESLVEVSCEVRSVAGRVQRYADYCCNPEHEIKCKRKSKNDCRCNNWRTERDRSRSD